MFRNYFKTALRNLWRNKTFSLINLTGLSLGLASVMTLVLLVKQFVTTDGFHINKSNIYYLKTSSPGGQIYIQTTFPLLYEIQKSCPEVLAATHWQGWDQPWLKWRTKEAQGDTKYVDTGFFNIF